MLGLGPVSGGAISDLPKPGSVKDERAKPKPKGERK